PAIQYSDQSSSSEQAAIGLSTAVQTGAENTNTPVRVGSYGDDGSVEQSNDVSSKAKASNDNDTHQTADQDVSGGGAAATTVQIGRQQASTGQLAGSASGAFQTGAANSNSPVRVGSSGDGGSVDQSNKADSSARSSNDNHTGQSIDQDPTGSSSQDCGCHGS